MDWLFKKNAAESPVLLLETKKPYFMQIYGFLGSAPT
jgi:hypothetical protein